MRTNKKPGAICTVCESDRFNSIEMFDIDFGGLVVTVCDNCNSLLFKKTLSADCGVNAKLKSPQDMNIILKRKDTKWRENLKGKDKMSHLL